MMNRVAGLRLRWKPSQDSSQRQRTCNMAEAAGTDGRSAGARQELDRHNFP